jgi:predicted aldo/keto reductase-like oxidoreductase
MQTKTLGKTGLIVSEVGFGGIPIRRVDKSTAVTLLRYAYEKGITLYDTANMYSDSEEKMGRAFEGIRHNVVLATKTMKRDAEGALQQLDNSLRMLKTDYIDIYQLHQVAQDRDFDAVFAPGGVYDALVKAKEQGKIRHIGVTSHNLQMAIKLVKTDLFSTIQFPFNFIETDAKEELHVEAKKRNIAVLAMKPFAGGVIDNASVAFAFLRQYQDVIPLPGFDSIKSIDEIIALYARDNVITQKDQELMDVYRAKLGKQFCRRCEYCQPCPNGVSITAAMGYKLYAARMSPAVAANFAKNAMQSVASCTECGECITRCPYELPIPDMLKENYELYKTHCAQ